MKEDTKALIEFQAWIKTVDRAELECLLCDAIWKGQISKTDLSRMFDLSRRGIDTRGVKDTEKPEPPVDTDCEELSKLETASVSIVFWIIVGSLWATVIYFVVQLYKIVVALNG